MVNNAFLIFFMILIVCFGDVKMQRVKMFFRTILCQKRTSKLGWVLEVIKPALLIKKE